MRCSFALIIPLPARYRQVELVPGGRERPVTAGNRLEYIHRVANFRLNAQIKRGADAFQRGLEEVIAREWVSLFNEGELQVPNLAAQAPPGHLHAGREPLLCHEMALITGFAPRPMMLGCLSVLYAPGCHGGCTQPSAACCFDTIQCGRRETVLHVSAMFFKHELPCLTRP